MHRYGGILYTGSDIGGFGSDTTEDLLMRWIEFGMFTPLMRNHAAIGTREQELYKFSHIDDFRNLIRLRYRLAPYLYSEFMKCVLENEMYFKPLAFEFPEDYRCQLMTKGHHYVPVALNEVVIFVRKDHMLPLACMDEKLVTMHDIDFDNVEWLGYVENQVTYTYYKDDGMTKQYTRKEDWDIVEKTKEMFEGYYISK